MAAPCPFLPACGRELSWRDLDALRDNSAGELYLTCLAYAQQLWLDDLPARSLLAVDRALYCDVAMGSEALVGYPLPYATIGWMVSQPSNSFTGNVRVHYQHLADRVRGERAPLKKWRAWAAWAIVRKACPALPGDPRHTVVEPTHATITEGLNTYGLPGETLLWQAALSSQPLQK